MPKSTVKRDHEFYRKHFFRQINGFAQGVTRVDFTLIAFFPHCALLIYTDESYDITISRNFWGKCK